MKINCDGSWFSSSSRVGFGFVARDSTSLIMSVRAGFREGASSALEAEGFSLFNAMNWAAEDGLISCIFEIDSCHLFNLLLTGRTVLTPKYGWARSCANSLVDNGNWKLSLVRREKNVLADYLARRAGLDGWIWNCSHAILVGVGRV